MFLNFGLSQNYLFCFQVNFANWAGLFTTFDCAFAFLQGREANSFTAVASGFCTAGILTLRYGVKVAGRNAVSGAVIMSIIELVLRGRDAPGTQPFVNQNTGQPVARPTFQPSYSSSFAQQPMMGAPAYQ